MQMEEMMDLVQAGAVQAIDLRQKQEELRETDQNYIQVPHSQALKHMLRSHFCTRLSHDVARCAC